MARIELNVSKSRKALGCMPSFSLEKGVLNLVSFTRREVAHFRLLDESFHVVEQGVNTCLFQML